MGKGDYVGCRQRDAIAVRRVRGGCPVGRVLCCGPVLVVTGTRAPQWTARSSVSPGDRGCPTSLGGGGGDDRGRIASPEDRLASVPAHSFEAQDKFEHRFVPELVVAITAPSPILSAIDQGPRDRFLWQ